MTSPNRPQHAVLTLCHQVQREASWFCGRQSSLTSYETMDRQITPLRQARLAAGWSQEQAIVRLEGLGRTMGIALPARSSLRTLLSAFENGHRRVPEHFRSIFRELYRVTDTDLGFEQRANILSLPALPELDVAHSERPTPEILTYLINVRAEHAKADALLGPRYLIPPVQSQLPLIDRLCQAARGIERNGILLVAARFAEFCGWLYQDLGHTDSALYWTNYALDRAYELGNEQLIAYTLHRKSNIVTEAGSPGQGLGLANAALRASKSLPPHTRAVALRQQARAHALLSEPSEFRRAIDEALACASQEDSDGIDNPARYCTPSYVEMEAGISWMKLGSPDIAASVFRNSLRAWPEHAQMRDRGLCLARLSTALAMEGDVDEACKTATEALTVADSTGSARIRSQLRACVGSLSPLAKHPAVQELEHQLSNFASG